ncbi:unnamed protein product [Caenorhabditis bovis]|uniref:Acid phosphatase n=1 Tax=Caenorhabditis bovis TaxID=2654633 RepID=A0A8S1E522_9PELO|nr:unnamed protein product [Caenorhabditis bovis]
MPSQLWYLVLLLFAIQEVRSQRKLVFVQALWRHGDRAPLQFPYPNDKYTEEYWDRGWSQLTSLGMTQLRELGTFFRQSYIDTGFVSSNFSTKEIYLRSSDSDRALVSAQSFLYGMYPATGNFRFDNNIDWQPIPVHANSPGEPDLVCKTTAIKCARRDELVDNDDAQDAEFYQKKYSDLFATLAESTGLPNLNYTDVNGLYDITRELIHNMTDLQPSWVFRTWPQYDNRTSLDIITEMRAQRMVNLYNTEEKSKLAGGTVINAWISNVNQFINQTDTLKMHLYSSHDGVVMALMNALGIADGKMIPYASVIIMNIFEENNKYFVEMLYRNNTAVPPYAMSLPRCPQPCEFSTFSQNYQNMSVSSYAELMELCGTPLRDCNDAASLRLSVLFFSITVLMFRFLF